MPRGSNHAVAGAVIALVLVSSWGVAYRMGARSGQNLAVEIAGAVETEALRPSPTSPSNRPAPTARPTATASVIPRPPPPQGDDTGTGATAELAPPSTAPSPEAVSHFLSILAEPHTLGLLNLRLHQAAQNLGLADVPKAIDDLAALPAGPRREAALLAVVGRWAQLAPEEAIDYATGEAIPALRTRMIESTFAGWAASDPTGALAYLEQNPDWLHRETAEDALFEGLAGRPATEVFQFLEQIGEGTRGEQVHRTISRLLELDPVGVRDWAQGLPESTLRDAVVMRSITAWANYQPVEAKDWIMENLEGEKQAAQLPRLASAWARNDPEAARDWYLDLPSDLQTPRVAEEVFESWLEEDRDAAAAYLDNASPRAELDQGFKEYAYQLQRHDPTQAMEQTGKIVDDETRSDTQSRVARYWAQRNPRAVLAYLETSSIAVEEQAPLIRYAESRIRRQTQRNHR